MAAYFKGDIMIYERLKEFFKKNDTNNKIEPNLPITQTTIHKEIPKIKYDIRDILHTKTELYQFINMINSKPISYDEYEIYKNLGESTHNTLIEEFEAYQNIYPNRIAKIVMKIDERCYLYEYNNSIPMYKMLGNKWINIEYFNEPYIIFINPIIGIRSNILNIGIVRINDMKNNNPFTAILSINHINMEKLNNIENILEVSDQIEKSLRQYDTVKNIIMSKNKPNQKDMIVLPKGN